MSSNVALRMKVALLLLFLTDRLLLLNHHWSINWSFNITHKKYSLEQQHIEVLLIIKKLELAWHLEAIERSKTIISFKAFHEKPVPMLLCIFRSGNFDCNQKTSFAIKKSVKNQYVKTTVGRFNCQNFRSS